MNGHDTHDRSGRGHSALSELDAWVEEEVAAVSRRQGRNRTDPNHPQNVVNARRRAAERATSDRRDDTEPSPSSTESLENPTSTHPNAAELAASALFDAKDEEFIAHAVSWLGTRANADTVLEEIWRRVRVDTADVVVPFEPSPDIAAHIETSGHREHGEANHRDDP